MRYTVVADNRAGYSDIVGRYWLKSTAIKVANSAKKYGYNGLAFYRNAQYIRGVYVNDRSGAVVYEATNEGVTKIERSVR